MRRTTSIDNVDGLVAAQLMLEMFKIPAGSSGVALDDAFATVTPADTFRAESDQTPTGQ